MIGEKCLEWHFEPNHWAEICPKAYRVAMVASENVEILVRSDTKVTFVLPLYSKIRKRKDGGRWKTFFVYLSREEVLKFQDRFGDVSNVEEKLVLSNSEESDD